MCGERMTIFHDASEKKKVEKPKKKRKRNKALTNPELRQIKRSLNISSKAPFKKCPAKVKRKLDALAKKGEGWHSDVKHAACAECGCDKVAGMGTQHYGSGLCYRHEQSKRYSGTAARINKADIYAQQQRHPRHFRDADEYLAQVEYDGKEVESRFNLTPQMESAKEICTDICDRLSDFDKDRDEGTKTIIDKMEEVIEIVNSNQSFSDDEKEKLTDTLLRIERKVTNPLTAKGSKGPVEMSSETRYKLHMEAIESLTKITATVQKLQAITMITGDSFKEWTYKLYQELKKEFGTMTYLRSDGQTEIITGVGEAMRVAGNPRKGI